MTTKVMIKVNDVEFGPIESGVTSAYKSVSEGTHSIYEKDYDSSGGTWEADYWDTGVAITDLEDGAKVILQVTDDAIAVQND